jgi:hypothetical protein
MKELLGQYLPFLERDPNQERVDISAGGVIISVLTNSPNIQRMGVHNWPKAPPGVVPQIIFYLITGIPGQAPHFWYCPELRMALSINSSYYGEMKSRALGMGMDVLQPMGVHSIHGSCLDIGGRGLVIIAPTGTGKSTLCAMLEKKVPGTRIHSDDWIYIEFLFDEKGRPRLAIGRYSELFYYMRTATATSQPSLAEVFENSLLENVPIDEAGHYIWKGFGNSRALIDPLNLVSGTTIIAKENRLARFTSIEKVVFLRRDPASPELVRLDPAEAVRILSEGKMQYLPGSGRTGPGTERWLNPYVLVNRENLIHGTSERALLNIDFQNYLFALLFGITGGAYYLNTAKRTPKESLKILQEIITEPSTLALDFDCHAYLTDRIKEALESYRRDRAEEMVQIDRRFNGVP